LLDYMSTARPGPRAQTGPNWPSLARALRGAGWHNVALGLLGSLAMAVAGPKVLTGYDGPSTRWWLSPSIPPQTGDLGNYLVCYTGTACLTLAWFAVLRRLRRSTELRSSELMALGGLWAVPLVAGPPLFSRDIYSYLAQGMLAHLRLSPYHYPPAVLGVVGFGHLLQVVSPVWRMTTAPYGPAFLWLAGWLAGVSAGGVIGGVVLFRIAELAGIMLFLACLPKIAEQVGASSREALWVGALSPLVLFELLSSGHNDAVMVGLLSAGLLAALRRWPLAGVALCSLATLWKLPALVGAAFITWAWAREQPGLRAKLAAGAAAAGVALVTLLAGSALTDGFGWISASVLLVPDKVTTPVSPTESLASLVHLVTGMLGLGISGALVGDLVRGAGLLAAAATVLVLLARVEHRTLVPSIGAAMIVLALVGTDAWPWYLTWGIVPLAAWRPAQRSWFLIGAAALFDFVVTPAGQVAVPDVAAPAVAFVWAGLAFALWKRHGPLRPRSSARRRLGPKAVRWRAQAMAPSALGSEPSAQAARMAAPVLEAGAPASRA